MHTVRAAQRQGKPIACWTNAEISKYSQFYIIDSDEAIECFTDSVFETEKYYQISIYDIDF
jgi:hypothetical protein